MIAQATLCATSWGRQLRSCRKVWRWKLHAVTVAVTWVSSVIDESSVTPRTFRWSVIFMSYSATATWVGQTGLARRCRVANKAATDLSGLRRSPLCHSRCCRLLEHSGCLCKFGWTGWKAGVNVDIVCILVEVNSRVTDQSTDRCHISGV